jgi:hypothetical protein
MMRQSWCDSSLITHGDIEELVPADGSYWTNSISLFRLFELEPDVLADWPCPKWEAATPATPGAMKRNGETLIGFCYEAGKAFESGSARSMSKQQAQKIVDSVGARSGIRFLNLHREPTDLRGVENPDVSSIDKLMAVIASCDLILTVDTFVAHIAAAMQKPTWVMLSHSPGDQQPSWYWLGPRGAPESSTPLYPTMRLFRSHTLGFGAVVADVCRELYGAGVATTPILIGS